MWSGMYVYIYNCKNCLLLNSRSYCNNYLKILLSLSHTFILHFGSEYQEISTRSRASTAINSILDMSCKTFENPVSCSQEISDNFAHSIMGHHYRDLAFGFQKSCFTH